ncbi:MAG: sugar kinase [Clostridiales bacterium]|nr:sugar kinase [Clostridiales bacterium]
MNGKISAFGEIMLRLSAGDIGIASANAFDACYGGTECNVLACLSQFGYNTQYLTALPDTELGNAAVNHIKSFGIDTSNIVRRGDVMGIYFVENGNGSRGSNVIYMRRFSEFTRLTQDDYDYDRIFDGITLFHISGISFALSESSRQLAFRLIDEAKRRGVKVSFDFNYRAKLWDTTTAAQYLKQAASKADIVLASTLDLSVFLNVTEAEYYYKYNSEYLVLRDRKILATDKHSVKVTVYRNNGQSVERYSSPVVEFAVTEKIGGGDAFDGAMLHGLRGGKDLKSATTFAIAAFALKHKIAGDTFSGTENDVLDYKATFGDLLK